MTFSAFHKMLRRSFKIEKQIYSNHPQSHYGSSENAFYTQQKIKTKPGNGIQNATRLEVC